MPREASINDVFSLVKGNNLEWRYGNKESHVVITDSRLKAFADSHEYGHSAILDCEMVIVISKGQKVKKNYIKRLVAFLNFIRENQNETE
jgi:hypothetical protein